MQFARRGQPPPPGVLFDSSVPTSISSTASRPAARTRPGRVLSEHRRDPGVQDRNQQPAGRIRALQRRRGEPHDQIGHQCVPRQPVRVLPQRSAERAQFLRLGQPREAAVPPQSVRRCHRRAGSAEPDVLLCRLSGTAANDRPDDHLDRPDRIAASGDLHRSHQWPRAGHLRSSDDHSSAWGQSRAQPVRQQHDSRLAVRSRGAEPAATLPAADERRHRQQLPPARKRVGRSGSVQLQHRSSVHRARPDVRAADPIRRVVHPGDTAARRKRRHDRHARTTEHDLLVVCVELSTDAVLEPAERTAHRRHAAKRRPDCGPVEWQRAREYRAPGHPVGRGISEYRSDVHHRRDGLSAARLAGEHRVGFRHERHTDRRYADVAERASQHQDGRAICAGSD